jgi:hypothetical protein
MAVKFRIFAGNKKNKTEKDESTGFCAGMRDDAL